MKYHIDNVDASQGANYEKAKKFGQILLDNCKEVVDKPPVYRDVALPTAPSTEITAKGDIVYTESSRQNVRKLESYVKEMASGGALEHNVNLDKVQSDLGESFLVSPLSMTETNARRQALGAGQLATDHHASSKVRYQVHVRRGHQVARTIISPCSCPYRAPRYLTSKGNQAKAIIVPVLATQRRRQDRGRGGSHAIPALEAKDRNFLGFQPQAHQHLYAHLSPPRMIPADM